MKGKKFRWGSGTALPAFGLWCSCVVLMLAPGVLAQEIPSAPVTQQPIEHLLYRVEWNPPWYLFFLPRMEAGEVELARFAPSEYEGRNATRIVFKARSSGTLARLTGVSIDDIYEFYSDPSTLCTFFVRKREREGKRKRDIEITYFSEARRLHIRELDMAFTPPRVKRDEDKQNIPACVRDLFSALYHTRTLEFSVGSGHLNLVGNNDKVKEIETRTEKKEFISTPAGRFETWRINTVALVGGLFKEGGQFHIWLTADWRRMPVQFEANVSLGTVTGRLRSSSGQLEMPLQAHRPYGGGSPIGVRPELQPGPEKLGWSRP